MKIYTDDPNLPYKTTKLSALYTKHEIDGLLAKWGVKDSMWHWDPEHNDVFLEFKFTETIEGVTLTPIIRVTAPTIWNHKTRNKEEEINWNISLRVMYWFIKSHMETAYLLLSDKTTAFLPYISSPEGETLAKVVIRHLEQIQNLPALPQPSREQLERVLDTPSFPVEPQQHKTQQNAV